MRRRLNTLPLWVFLVLLVAGRASAELPSPEALRAATTVLLTEWARLQHAGDSKGYLALYDARHFKGTKRTTSGDRKEYSYAAWAADRTKMMKNRPEVSVENVRIDTWRDGKTKLKPNLIHVRFTQRWRTPRYADHGPKIMQLVYADDKGKIVLKIVYEGLLQSRPGWDQVEASKVSLKTPATDAEARALWLTLAPTGKDWEQKLASIPDVPQLRRALARAVLAEDLDCKNFVDEGQCGVEDWRWGPLPEQASFEDPCLRRLLAIWALGELDAADLKAPQLLKVFDYKRPAQDTLPGRQREGDELCVAIIDAAKATPALLTQVIPPAIASHCGENEARAAVAALPEKARVTLAENDVEEALASLSPKTYPAVLIGALDGTSSDDFKVGLMKDLARAHLGPPLLDKLKTTLRTVADDAKTSAHISTAAALALESLGDKSRLPRRPDNTNAADFERQLARLYHDTDPDRRAKQLRAFLPPGKGQVDVVTSDEYEYDGNTAVEDRREDETKVDHVPSDQVDWDALRVFLAEPTDGESQQLTWKIIGKKLYLVEISSTSRHFSGCGC